MLNRWHTFGLSAILALSTMSVALAQGVSQAFTYQGFLRQSGVPVTNPSQGMRFRIYDGATIGVLVWDSGNVTVNVQNGLFTVQLNAPATVWTGAPRFLEIQVNPATSGPILSPRIPLNPTPYANTSTQLNMFQSGTSNPDRMVITHSPPFSDWGLQYRDNDDSFHFLAGGVSRFRVGLGDGRIDIPFALRIPTGAAAGRVLTSNAAGDATWQDLPASATVWAVSGANIHNTNTGNVGVGTNAPGFLLDVRSDRAARLLNVVNSSTSAVGDGIWVQTAGVGSWGVHSDLTATSGRAISGNASNASGTGVGVFGRSASAAGYGGYFVGRAYIEYNSTVDRATLRLHETEAEFARLEFTNTNTARKWHIAGLIGTAVANDRLNFWNSSAGDLLSIRGDGTVSVKVLEITGADLAEKFPTTDAVEPGMVVEIDPDTPGHLRKAQGAYNRRVVGVVAGANGLSKGIILGNLEGSENHTAIAMSGRVWVYADATERAIEPGDFLTTADKPGYAMAAGDLAQAQGAIIGKAMTRLEKGTTGMVLVVVNLQ